MTGLHTCCFDLLRDEVRRQPGPPDGPIFASTCCWVWFWYLRRRQLVALNTFDVHRSQLTGNMPDLGELASLDQFVADDNRLTGPAPAVSGPRSSIVSQR